MKRELAVTLGRALVVATLVCAASGTAVAQGPKVFYACYVPNTGTVYRIKEPGTPTACLVVGKSGGSVPHVEFSWTDGAGGGSADHGALAGLTDDDHSQYLLTDGMRTATNGFAVNGTINVGSIPAIGAGVRMMWYPRKAAFRAGSILYSSMWEDAQIGGSSVAMGHNAVASAFGSVAIGVGAFANGSSAVGLGEGGADGHLSFAVGNGRASGLHAVAMGASVLATGDYSMALGKNASTDGKAGAFVWGDASASPSGIKAVADNQFVARASQFWLGNNDNVTAPSGHFIETSTGAFLSSGGTWTNSSDVARKTGFADVDGEEVLARLAAMPVTSWTYRDEADSVRHMGPTAQDFRAAFSLGSTDKAIATVDADGVSLAAIKALVSRTEALQARVEQLEAALRELVALNGVARK